MIRPLIYINIHENQRIFLRLLICFIIRYCLIFCDENFINYVDNYKILKVKTLQVGQKRKLIWSHNVGIHLS